MTPPAPSIQRHGDVTCIGLGVEFETLDETLLDRVRSSLLDAVSAVPAPPRIVLDLHHTKFFGSSFIEVLFRIWNRVNASNGRFAIAGMSPYCREVMAITHLDKLWTLTASVDEAVTVVSKD